MNIKLELLKGHLWEMISRKIDHMNIDADKIADTTAISALSEIQRILSDQNTSDFDAVENIISVFEKYGLDYGSRHDF